MMPNAESKIHGIRFKDATHLSSRSNAEAKEKWEMCIINTYVDQPQWQTENKTKNGQWLKCYLFR